MNHIVKRTITALSVATIVVLGLLYLPKGIVYALLAALIVLVHLEFSKMVSRKYEILVWPGVLMGVFFLGLLMLRYYFSENPISTYQYSLTMPLSLIPLIFFILAICVLFSKAKKPLEALGMTMLGFLYIPFMLMFMLLIPMTHVMNPDHGIKILLYIIAITKISDMGGFAFGMAFGKHKMCPSISPKKSWEGMAGSIFASCLISCAFMPLTKFDVCKALALGVMAAVVGTLGDLVESRFKRDVDVKDSSQFKWTNGMGGFLDMFDSLIFVPAAFFLYKIFFKLFSV